MKNSLALNTAKAYLIINIIVIELSFKMFNQKKFLCIFKHFSWDIPFLYR